jgi:hypothetical protein
MNPAKRKLMERRLGIFLTTAEMVFSLLMIPCGLAFTASLEAEKLEDVKTIMVPAAFFCLALATFFRAAGNRYKEQNSVRRLSDRPVFQSAVPGDHVDRRRDFFGIADPGAHPGHPQEPQVVRDPAERRDHSAYSRFFDLDLV